MEFDDSQILDADLESAFEMLKIQVIDLADDKDKLRLVSDALKLVKDGVSIKFDVLYALTDNVFEDRKNQFVRIPDCRSGERFSLKAYVDELDDRKAIAKRALLKVNEEDSFYRTNQK